jgi:hypothetical protein
MYEGIIGISIGISFNLVWYTGKGREKFTRKVTSLLISGSILLLVLPPLLSYLFS